MPIIDYIVSKIEGEYAYLQEIGKGEESEIFIALYLLPMGINVGTKLRFENFEYAVID